MIPVVIDCFVDNMKLRYNTTTHRSFNAEGVTTRIPGWGNTSSLEWLDPSQARATLYFAAIADAAVKWGYTRGMDLRGAPYDFRKAPDDNPEFFPRLKALIEETYVANGNKAVVTIGHSMGNSFLLYFFNRQTQAWKDKFIKSFVSIAGPFGGSAKIMKVLATGYTLDHWQIFLPPSKLRPEQRAMTSTPFLLPFPSLWGPNDVLVETATRNYTSSDYQQFFTDIGYPVGWDVYQSSGKVNHQLTPPNVEVYCIYGVQMRTPEKFVYAKGYFPDYEPTIVYGDGDGTVNIRSAKGTLRIRLFGVFLLY